LNTKRIVPVNFLNGTIGEVRFCRDFTEGRDYAK